MADQPIGVPTPQQPQLICRPRRTFVATAAMNVASRMVAAAPTNSNETPTIKVMATPSSMIGNRRVATPIKLRGKNLIVLYRSPKSSNVTELADCSDEQHGS
jgi:hypothetical protein